ncbi:hypothetical protein ENBRE01_2498 [Enteropsectra breve]|nr:hypothetical protein ENBRE01_2498 [Enteropsectra breve]
MFWLSLVRHLAAQSAGKYDTKFMSEHSLMAPHVGENGKNNSYDFDGKYSVIKTERLGHVQLGYQAAHTGGLIQLKTPLKKKNFRYELEFLHEPEATSGSFGLWISEPMTSGEFHGRNGNFKGMGIIVRRGSYVTAQVVSSSDSVPKTPAKNVAMSPGLSILIVECHSGHMKVKMSSGGHSTIIYDGKAHTNPSYIVGVSASTGASVHPVLIKNLIGYSLNKLPNSYVKGEGSRNNKLVIFAGLVAIGGIIYYLYTRQNKEVIFKS